MEWYDRGAIKVNRQSAPNLLVLKRNIKYMYKADERVEPGGGIIEVELARPDPPILYPAPTCARRLN